MSSVPLNHGLGPFPDRDPSSTDRLASANPLSYSWPVGVPRQLNYPNMPAWGLLERTASTVPDRIATYLFETQLTYGEIFDAANRLASWLQHNGVNSGERVGVLLPNMPEYLIALNGIWRAGGVAVALSPLSVPNDLAKLLAATDCRIVICLDALTNLLADTSNLETTMLVSLREYLPTWKKAGYMAKRWQRTGHLSLPSNEEQIWMWDAIEASSQEVDPIEIHPARDPAYILSTGGTMEDPKAVTLSHRNIVANALQQSHWAGATMGEETLLAVLPFFHSYGMSAMIAGGTAMGATLIMQPRFDATRVITAIERNRPTLFHAVPSLLAALNKRLRRPNRRKADLSSLKWVISGGAALPVSIAEEFARHSGAIVVEGFGLSEASPVTHVGPLDGTNRLGTIGFPLPDTECRIVDSESGVDVPVGEIGELLIRGPQVMLGYWNNPRATAESIRNGWLYTGDLATVDQDGFYRIVGRKKELIITSGFNVYPADVEEVLLGCDLIKEVSVVGASDDERGEVVKAFVVLKDGCDWEPEKLNRYCEQHLAAHRRPRLWEQVIGELPKDYMGKTLRKKLGENSGGDTDQSPAGDVS